METSFLCISFVAILSRLQFSLCLRPPTTDAIQRRQVLDCLLGGTCFFSASHFNGLAGSLCCTLGPCVAQYRYRRSRLWRQPVENWSLCKMTFVKCRSKSDEWSNSPSKNLVQLVTLNVHFTARVTVLKFSNSHTSVSYRKQCVVSHKLIILFFFFLIRVIHKNIKCSAWTIKCFHSPKFIITVFQCNYLKTSISPKLKYQYPVFGCIHVRWM